MHQVQSALRDLIWAHAGRVDGLPQVVGREERGNARAAFQRFVRSVVDSVREDHPLVMIDATHTRNLWTWLTNLRIGQTPLTMDGQEIL